MKDATNHRFSCIFDASRTPPSYLTTCSEREGPFSVEGRGKRNMPLGKQRLVKSQVHVGQRFRCLGGVGVCLCFHDIDNICCFWTPYLCWFESTRSSHPCRLAAQKGNLDGGSKPSSTLAQVLNKGLLGQRILEAKGRWMLTTHGWCFFMFFHVWVLVDGKTWQIWLATLIGVECLTA